MPVLSINPTRRVRQTSTVLAENLEVPKFDLTQSALSLVDEENKESTSKYLEVAGVAELDKQFNDLVKKYESDFELQSLDITRQANIQAQDALMQAGEGVLGKMSTGAAADLRSDTVQIVSDSAEAAQSELTEQYAQVFGDLSENANALLEQLMGSITEYNENVDLFGMALFEEIAEQAGLKYGEGDDYEYKTLEDALVKTGFIEQIGDTDTFRPTALGLQEIAGILQSPDDQYGTVSERLDRLVGNVVEQIMSKKYPTLSPGDTAYDNKAAELEIQFNEWLQENSTTMYYTDLGLATFESGRLQEIPYIVPEVSENALDFVDGDGWNVYNIDATTDNYVDLFGKYVGSNREGSKQTEYVNQILSDARSGNIPDGSFVLMNYGKTTNDTSIFYYENGRIYKTAYTLEQGLPTISANSFYCIEDSGDDVAGKAYNSRLSMWEKFTLRELMTKLNQGIFSTNQSVYFYGTKYTVGADGILYKTEPQKSHTGGGGGAR